MLAACGGSQFGNVPSAVPLSTHPIDSKALLTAKVDGRLYVDDYGNNAVEIVANGGRAPSLARQLDAPGWNKIGTIGAFLSDQPVSNWVDKRGDLYVPDYNVGFYAQVSEYTSSGSLKCTYSTNMRFPLAVTTDAKGDVFEADGLSGINEYHQGSDALVATCPHFAGGQRGIAVDAAGDVFVSYYLSGGGAISEYVGGLTGCSQTVPGVSLGVPGGIVFDKDANLVVCDETNQVVDIIAPPYNQISGHLGKTYGPFIFRYDLPSGISINKNNTLAYVTDWGNQRVDVVTYPAGAPFAQVGSGSGLSHPTGAVDESNYVP